MKFKHTTLALGMALLTQSLHVRANDVDQITDTSVVRYFKEKIEDFEKKTNYNLGKGRTLKISEVPAAQQRIWKSWKVANQGERLPNSVVTKPKALTDFKAYQWELHGEYPMPFYYFKKGKRPESGYPLFLNIHGSGPKAEEFKATLSLSLMYKDAPSSYFIPQIPNSRRYRWWYKPEQYAWEKLFRLAMTDDSLNVNKLYIIGISEGGYGSQRLGAFYADYIAGAGPMAGGEPLENAPPLNFRNIAFSLQTGAHDTGFGRNTLTMKAKKAFDSLAVAYPNQFIHKIELQPGKGHSIDYTVTSPWLGQYTRNPQPSAVSWVLFPMDGRYRKGFYNVSIDKPLNIKEGAEFDRAAFQLEMHKKDNSIQLEVSLQNSHGTKNAEVKEGEISIFLSSKLLDLSKKVKVFYKGKLIYHQKVVLDEHVVAESCALFGDPERLFPAKIKVVL